MKQFVQGDILFIKVESLPTGVIEESGKIVARGEKTGHVHAIEGPGVLLSFERSFDRTVRFLQADADVEIRHDEHRPLKLERGVYEIRQQRVYDPTAKRAEPVED
jgi:hypothetical protein